MYQAVKCWHLDGCYLSFFFSLSDPVYSLILHQDQQTLGNVFYYLVLSNYKKNNIFIDLKSITLCICKAMVMKKTMLCVETYFWLTQFSKTYTITVFITLVRQLTLYSTDDEPCYELELCPTRKKSSHLSFCFIFSSDMQDWLQLNCPFSLVLFSFLRHHLAKKFNFYFFPLRHGRKSWKSWKLTQYLLSITPQSIKTLGHSAAIV